MLQPRQGRREPPVPARVLMTFTRLDFHDSLELAAGAPQRHIVDCPFLEITWQGREIGISGPAPGAPYAVMVLEKLVALGARLIIALGWAGSLQPEARVGDLIVPVAALSEEGTSPHYPNYTTVAQPDEGLCRAIQANLAAKGLPYHAGPIWTTDAIYRETKGKVTSYGRQGLWAVEMEMSALFTVARYRGVALAGLLVISDELFTLTWRHGLRDERLHQARRQARQTVLATLHTYQL